jgi:RNase P subunit RPR2
MKRDPKLQKSLDRLARSRGFVPVREAIERKICSRCRKPAVEFKDHLSEKEYKITGFCQKCQDWLFSAPEE